MPAHPPSTTEARPRRRPEFHILAVTIALVLATDLAVKATVAALVPPGHRLGPLVPLTNPRFMLGVAGTEAPAMVALMTAGVIAAVLVAVLLLHQHRVSATAAGLVIGGGAANTVDRAVHGTVQDHLLIGDVVVNSPTWLSSPASS